MGYQRVLVPVSGKHRLKRAARALEHALRVVREDGEVCFLHCLTEMPYLLAGEEHRKLVMGDAREAEKLLSPLAERVRDSGIAYSVHILEGSPLTHIPRFVLERECEIVVMCVGDYSGSVELAMGGVAERVFNVLGVPLIIVH